MDSAQDGNDLLWETMESYCLVTYKQDTKSSSQSPEPCFILALMGPLTLQLVKVLEFSTSLPTAAGAQISETFNNYF